VGVNTPIFWSIFEITAFRVRLAQRRNHPQAGSGALL
jgi:hypothetical protein